MTIFSKCAWSKNVIMNIIPKMAEIIVVNEKGLIIKTLINIYLLISILSILKMTRK